MKIAVISDHIPIIESPVNIYRTQIILNETQNISNHKIYKVFNKKRVVIEIKNFNEKLMLDIMKKVIPPKGIVGIFSIELVFSPNSKILI